MKAQIDDIAYAHNALLYDGGRRGAGGADRRRRARRSRPGVVRASGSEAVEAALKLARQYFLEIGQKQRTRLIARRQAYHGNTIGALSVGGHPARRRAYEPWLFDASPHRAMLRLSPQGSRRDRGGLWPPRRRRARARDPAPGARHRRGLPRRAGGGGDHGAVPAVQGLLHPHRRSATAMAILLILDEVMCGMGRTGTMFACEQEGDRPRHRGDGEGARRRLSADRRGDRRAPDQRRDQARVGQPCSTATPTWRTRSAAPRHSPSSG